MNRLELDITQSLPNINTFPTRWEKERYVRCLKRWKADNPKADIPAQCLFDNYIRLHFLTQRLYDNRQFFDGSLTTLVGNAISSEDVERKQKELKEWLGVVQKLELEVIKVALASSVNLLSITGDSKSVTDLIRATKQLRGQSGSSDTFT